MKKTLLIVALMGIVTLSAVAATYPAWDINQDGVVNIFDIVVIAGAFGTSPGDANWNPACDVRKDGVIDIYDLVAEVPHFGETYK